LSVAADGTTTSTGCDRTSESSSGHLVVWVAGFVKVVPCI
jgi:hypothetical protein